MGTYSALSILLALCVTFCMGSFSPYEPGEHNVTYMAYRRTTTLGLPEDLEIWSPIEGTNLPVVWFFSGGGAMFPSDAYGDVMERIASNGFVVVGLWRVIGNEDGLIGVARIQDSIDYCKQHLQEDLIEEGVDASLTINYDLSFGFSQSNGANVMGNYLKYTEGCGDFKGIVQSSPVDGPPDWIITPPVTFNFDIPTLILPAGLDWLKEIQPVACAPDDISNRKFYDLVDPNSPRWFINSTEYGHADILDQTTLDNANKIHFCPTKENGTTEDYDMYRSFVAGQAVSFYKGFVEADCTQYLTYLEDIFLMPINVEVEFANPKTGCVTGYCKWTPPPIQPSTSTVETSTL